MKLHGAGRRIVNIQELLGIISISKIEKNVIRIPEIIVNKG